MTVLLRKNTPKEVAPNWNVGLVRKKETMLINGTMMQSNIGVHLSIMKNLQLEKMRKEHPH